MVGAGPAGCAAAIVLATAGWSVAACERPPVRDPVGESLSPAAPALLARLGLPDLLREHRPCHANVSVWGEPTPRWHDFVRDPRGHGYHLDRARFEARLRERAEAVGVRLLGPLGREVRAGWHVNVGGAEVRARHVVDASGRGAHFARAVGGRRAVAWDQAALVAFMRTRGPVEEAFSLVEAVEVGFWYTAPTPGGRFAVALFTDAALHADRAEGGRLTELLAAAPHTRARLEAHGAELQGPPRFVEAGSARLAQAHGPGWIAVGDAAMSYDPVSAHGITLALRTGIDGAEALLANAAGDATAPIRYQARLDAAFAAQRAEALRIFRAERRWADAPYWRKRHALG